MNPPSMAEDDGGGGLFSSPSYKRYALSGKIMLGAIILLLFVVILMIFLHLYVRLFLLSSSRHQSRSRTPRRRRRRQQFVFAAEPRIAAAVAAPSRALPQSILNSLPVFVHSTQPDPDPIYCAVCLSEFEENEIGRIIPKCNHRFHVVCIDMWFYSHVTCPLCRSEVKPDPCDDPVEIAIDVCEPGLRPREEEPERGCPVEMAASVELVNEESRQVEEMSGDGTARATANFVKSLSDKEETEAVGSER